MEFFALCAREAGKTLADGVRRCASGRFPALLCRAGGRCEHNTAARGVIAASRMEFSAAIFTGQIAAALSPAIRSSPSRPSRRR